MKKQAKETIQVKKSGNTATKIVYWIFQVLILFTAIAAIIIAAITDDETIRRAQISHIALCAVAVLLYNAPQLLQHRLKLYMPSAIHIFILIFIYAHFVLGEIVGLYESSAVFDKILHSTSGLVIALGGFSMVNLLNRTSDSHVRLNPFFVAFFAFCFALSVALLWEIFEYAADCIVGSNMQRYIPPTALAQEVAPAQGYGLIDTMSDLIVSTLSAFTVCVIGYILLKRNSKLLEPFLFKKSSTDTAEDTSAPIRSDEGQDEN